MLATSCLDSYYHEERQGVIIDTEFFKKYNRWVGVITSSLIKFFFKFMTEERLKYGESRSMRGTYKNYFYIVLMIIYYSCCVKNNHLQLKENISN